MPANMNKTPAETWGTFSDLFGVDVDEFATHLTTINLATRDLIDAENYPQIVRSDFFDLKADKAFMSLPIHGKGLGKIQHREVEIPRLDAVIGNPPYVRQEQIRKAKNGKNPEHGTKEYYQALVQREMGADLGGRSDIHCYFWPHAASFLERGRLSLFPDLQPVAGRGIRLPPARMDSPELRDRGRVRKHR